MRPLYAFLLARGNGTNLRPLFQFTAPAPLLQHSSEVVRVSLCPSPVPRPGTLFQHPSELVRQALADRRLSKLTLTEVRHFYIHRPMLKICLKSARRHWQMCYSLDWRVYLSSGLSLQTKADSSRCQTRSKLTISYSIQRIVAARNRSIRWSARQRVCSSGRQGNQVKDLDGTRHCKRFGSNSSGRVWSAVTERICLGRLCCCCLEAKAFRKA